MQSPAGSVKGGCTNTLSCPQPSGPSRTTWHPDAGIAKSDRNSQQDKGTQIFFFTRPHSAPSWGLIEEIREGFLLQGQATMHRLFSMWQVLSSRFLGKMSPNLCIVLQSAIFRKMGTPPPKTLQLSSFLYPIITPVSVPCWLTPRLICATGECTPADVM